ncbi:patatin-like phospholipase family protein [Owenweeksia hongkongensis]|nr:patatin-like phospholipase family protein [Owenweeksia hongkongensis]
MFRKLLLTFSAILIMASPGQGQNSDTCDISIGLVLSGGGSKSLAQIGALRVIEEAGVKIDYIAGTSMGAIIGALYSLGYSVDEIEEYMRKVDWDALLNNEIPRNRLSYFDRKSDSRYLLTLPVHDGKVNLPTGLNYAQYILKQLNYLTQQCHQYADFSEFPIPFLCVATNLEDGSMKVFEEGNLSDALRASAAFPSLFTPYEIDGELYADGGLVNNYPVEPLKEKGIEYIIGVDVQDFLYKKDELNSVMRILEQTSSFVNARQYQDQIQFTDLLIKPDLHEASITTFDLFDTIIARGEKAAREQLAPLLALAKSDTSAPINRAQCTALPLDTFYVADIKIEGIKSSSEEFILGKLRVKEGHVCTIEKLDRGLDQLYGSKYFKHVNYSLTPVDTGYRITLSVKEEEALTLFRLGLHYDDDFKTALLLNYTQRNILFKNSRFSAEIALSQNPRANIHYYVDRGLVPTLGFSFRTNRFTYRIYDENRDPVAQSNYFDFSTDLFLQSTIYDAFAIGAGIEFDGVVLSDDLSKIQTDTGYSSYLNYYGFIDFDSFNDANYPTHGSKFSAKAKIIGRQEKFNTFYEPSSVIDVEFRQAMSFGKRVSMVAGSKFITTVGPDLDYPYNIFLGSMGKNYINYITPFIGYRYMELIGRTALVVRVDLNIEFLKNHYVMVKANAGKLENSIQNTLESNIVLDGYSLGYSYDSPIGPLEISVAGSTNHKDVYSYVSLGFWF